MLILSKPSAVVRATVGNALGGFDVFTPLIREYDPAADGRPVSTIRIENFRDGLEYLWYAKLAAERGVDVPVPESLVNDMWTFSDDSADLYAWRDALADAIERASP